MTDITKNLFMIKKNQLKMVKRRGFDISKEEPLLDYSYENFLEVYEPFVKKQKKSIKTVLSNAYKNNENYYLVVYFVDIASNKQLGVDILGDVISEMGRYKSKNAIIITPNPLSSDAKKKISGLLAYDIQTFMETEMGYDPTEHFLVPKHRALTVEEQRDFLSRNNISIDQLPAILTTDMISRYYAFKVGQIIEIKRTNLYDTIVQESTSYRAVREDLTNI